MRIYFGISHVLAISFCAAAMAGDTHSPYLRNISDNSVQLDISQQRISMAVDAPGDDNAPRLLFAHPPLPPAERMLPAGLLVQKAKQFDDGLYAAVELAAQAGTGPFAGKAAMLRAVADEISGGKPTAASSTWLAAMMAGGAKLENISPDQYGSAQWLLREFYENPLISKPLGFYTWNGPLGTIFMQDRLLQQEVHPATSLQTVVNALAKHPSAVATYSDYLKLTEQLTNPFAYPDLRPAIAAAQAGQSAMIDETTRIFPPSMAHETELVKRLFGNMPPPDGYSLIDDLSSRVRAGTIDLKPRPNSGWYDWQTWSLETMVAPDRVAEAEHLALNDGYRAALKDLFKGTFALQRETHVKQLEMFAAGATPPPQTPTPTIYITPHLRVEPVATYYLRRALGYRFIHAALLHTFGEQGLAGMRRLTENGAVTPSLASELNTMESLFLGAYVAANQDLGLVADQDPNADADLKQFLSWRAALNQDPDLTRDERMMVPLFYDRAHQKTKMLVFLGWQSQDVTVGYAKQPAVLHSPQGSALEFASDVEQLAKPVSAEIYVAKILNRQEMRALCDKYQTAADMIRALQGQP